MENDLLCWRSDEVAGFSASPCSERERNGENGGEKEESKDQHLMENHWCQVFLVGALRVAIRSYLLFVIAIYLFLNDYKCVS